MTSIRHKPSDSTEAAPPSSAHDDVRYLDAARDAILAVGWSRTTLTDIARRAGVSRMTLYRRWPDMQTMLADLMTREWTRTVGEAVGSTPGSAGEREAAGPALQRITDGVVATVQALRANELLRRIIDLDPDLLLPSLRDRRGRSQELVTGVLARLVREGQQDGSVRPGDPRRLARSVVLACHGFVLSAHTMVDAEGGAAGPAPRDADVRHFDRELARMLEGYLQP